MRVRREWLVALLGVATLALACQQARDGPMKTGVVRKDWARIGYVDSADPLRVLHALERVLGVQGIDVAIEGSVLYDLLVPSSDTSRAMTQIRNTPELHGMGIHLYDQPRPLPLPGRRSSGDTIIILP
jgi:hypothetical protein